MTRAGKPIRNITIDRPKSLAAIVAERLRQAILRAEFALGEMVSEEKIASAMNVSRTPVREALTMLQMQGLITILPQRGSFVFKPDANDLRALVQFRLILETQAAPLALKNDPVRALARLHKAIDMMDRARETENILAYAEADTIFHNTFFEFCGNRYLKEAYEIAAGRVAALRAHLAVPLEMHRSRTYSEHLDMAAAFANGDLDTLLEILSQHIENMEGNYIRALSALEQPVRQTS